MAGDSARLIRTALLMNFIAPYRVPLLEQLRDRVGQLRVFVSTRMEPDRAWLPEWGSLDVAVQRNVMLPWRHRRPGGMIQQLYIHVPYDTLPQLIAYGPDVVVSGELGARSLQAALYRRLRPRSRLILWATLSEHTEQTWGLTRRLLRRFIVRSADAVIVNGQSGARYIATLAPELRTQVVNQVVDAGPFCQAPLHRGPSEERRLVFAGRLIAQKGVFELQRALAARALRHPARLLEIVWAGDGTERPVLEAEPMPANCRQRFTGHVSYGELARIYAGCGALILPTLWDEWGLVVNEALASGLPVLGSIYSQAVEELVDDGKTGWLLDPLNPESLQGALDRFLDAPTEQLAAMRAQARAHGMSLSLSDTADRIAAAVQSAAMQGRPAKRDARAAAAR